LPPEKFASLQPASSLQNLYADPRIAINRGDCIVFHSKRSDEFFERSKFVERARKLIKENEIARLQERGQRR
jgi:hypothetical protein